MGGKRREVVEIVGCVMVFLYIVGWMGVVDRKWGERKIEGVVEGMIY